eukprot:144122-Chlamydomonas_euryale.AAC.3
MTRQADLTKQMRIAQKRLTEARRANKRGPPVLSSRGEVGEADIARVISDWTGAYVPGNTE